MSAIRVLDIQQPVRTRVGMDSLWDLGTTHDVQVALIRKLQDLARGVARARRAALHRQFAQEWRQFIECGGGLGPDITEDAPLLLALYRQVSGLGESLVLSAS